MKTSFWFSSVLQTEEEKSEHYPQDSGSNSLIIAFYKGFSEILRIIIS